MRDRGAVRHRAQGQHDERARREAVARRGGQARELVVVPGVHVLQDDEPRGPVDARAAQLVERVGAAAHADAEELGARLQRLDEARAADPGLTLEQDGAARPVGGLGQVGLEVVELSGAADERPGTTRCRHGPMLGAAGHYQAG